MVLGTPDRWRLRPWCAPDVLRAWERGQGGGRSDRALALLSTGLPECTREELLALPLGRRDQLLLESRLHLLGSTLEGNAVCPACGDLQAFSLEIDVDLLPQGVALDAPAHRELRLGELVLQLRCPTGHDAMAVENLGPGAAWRELMHRAVPVASSGGQPVAATELPVEVLVAVSAELEKLDPLALVPLALVCAKCTFAWQPLLEIVDLLWAEVDNLAGRLMNDVQVLATAYGWSESEILAMSGRRRSYYLERAPSPDKEGDPPARPTTPFQPPRTPLS